MKIERQTGIMCTLGPSSRDKSTILRMAQNGMDVARLNFSHGTHEEHAQLIRNIRDVNKKEGFHIRILQDLEGYRIRVGLLASPVKLAKDALVAMAHEGHHAPEDIPLDFPEDFRGFAPGMEVFADDGNISLEVVTVSPGKLKLRVTQGGVLKPRKGVNIPELKLRANIMTEKDRADITFGLEHRVDFVAQSFVRNRNDIMRVEKIVRAGNPDCRVYAKIENHEGVRNLAAIIESCDGILIARGDLGVSLPIYKLPVIQKSVIRQCNKRKKYSVTATQMLESMTENKRPTRAEVSDVANAILDGSDYVMLSGETAAGRFPVESVKMMRQIIEYTEASIRLKV